MQSERTQEPTPQDIQIVRLVPEQTVSAMQQALIIMLQTLPTPITITPQHDAQQRTYYTYQVGIPSEQHPFGIVLGATPSFFDAVRFSLEAAMETNQMASSNRKRYATRNSKPPSPRSRNLHPLRDMA